ncbi:sugar phosphate isomerase/epimerase [Paenibacillus sp. WQ 127069]|uniref:Sugar phosphate isomerase/epimerase n=1 Tax=Paenibacillus baimaensis TaxID=2982185 RepID=A0ABT2UNL4_9BACL|nr:sugar phosphate isomerase/epimerase family protein [Paenibacillus sp. WQ 127069]MCU6795611.1 sugar phosphate isomerase/epimerase [Paenibacillus sp. WQ 127069]
MQYAVHSFSGPTLTLSQLMDTATTYGYAGVELRVGVGHAHGVELSADSHQRAEWKRLAVESGIPIICLGVSIICSRPDSDKEIASALDYIKLASDVGAPVLRVAGGKIPAGGTREQTLAAIERVLNAILPSAREHGITIAIETHDDWSDPVQMASLMRAVDDPQVVVLWDVLHTKRRGLAEPAEVITHLGPWIQHVHFHDASFDSEHKEHKPIGEGNLDFAKIAAALQSIHYKGYASGEWSGWEEPYQTHLPRELKAFQSFVERAAHPSLD